MMNAGTFGNSCLIVRMLWTNAGKMPCILPAMLDLLSDILTRLSLRGTLYFRTSFTEPWGVRVPAFRERGAVPLSRIRGEARMVRVEGHPSGLIAPVPRRS